MDAPSRRDVLGVGTSVLGVGAGLALMLANAAAFGPSACPKAAHATSPDAELLELCAKCDELQGQVDALWADRMTHLPVPEQLAIEHVRDAAQQPLLERMDPILDRICELQPATLQGHLVRARTYARWHKDLPERDSGHRDEALQGAVLRDLAALAELVA